MQIGILQTGHVPETLAPKLGDYADLFETLLADQKLTFARWNVVDMEFPNDVHECDGWLLTGSRHGAYEDLPFIAPLEDFVRAARAARVPVVGICFGHQIIAQALGGKVEKFDGGWNVGAKDYAIAGQNMTLNAWHQDQVTTLPKGATVVGTHPDCRYAALRYGDQAFSVQPHPEFQSEFIEGLINSRGRGVVPDDLLADAATRLPLPNNNTAMADMIGQFFRTAQEAQNG